MKKCWDKLSDEWVYELDAQDIVREEEISPDESELVLVICTPSTATEHRIVVDRT